MTPFLVSNSLKSPIRFHIAPHNRNAGQLFWSPTFIELFENCRPLRYISGVRLDSSIEFSELFLQ